jgi:hypothetical protein
VRCRGRADPGRPISIAWTSPAATYRITGLVVHASVSALHGHLGIEWTVGIRFDAPHASLWELTTHGG